MSVYVVIGSSVARGAKIIGVFETRGEAEANVRSYMILVDKRTKGVVGFDKYDVVLSKVGTAEIGLVVATLTPKQAITK